MVDLLRDDTSGDDSGWEFVHPGLYKITVETEDASVLNFYEKNDREGAIERIAVDQSLATLEMSAANNARLYVSHGNFLQCRYSSFDTGPVTVQLHEIPILFGV